MEEKNLKKEVDKIRDIIEDMEKLFGIQDEIEP